MSDQQPQKSTALAIEVGDKGLALKTFSDMWDFANAVVKAGMAPKGLSKPEQVLVALQAGTEVGLTPMQAMANVAVINGRPCLWGDALIALVRRSGLCEYIEETVIGRGEEMVATCKSKRKGEPNEVARTFSYADAKRAALLGKDTYKNYPQRMFAARARAWCLRDLYADVLAGMSVAEEVQDHQFTEILADDIEPGDDAPEDELEALAETMARDDVRALEHKPEVNPAAYGSGADGELTPEEEAAVFTGDQLFN